MKKGFTMMEVLVVGVLLALVLSFAMPAFRAVRFEMKQSQAKAATKKLAEAMRSYYQVSRGGTIAACFSGSEADTLAGGTCVNPAATGIPQSTAPAALASAEQLFACGFLVAKDFRDLPYQFCTYRHNGLVPPQGFTPPIYAVGQGNSAAAGSKYNNNNYIYVDGTMTPKDTYQ